jgi:hypothetical protein
METPHEQDLPYNLCYAAYANNSHTPTERAQQHQAMYVNDVQNLYAALLAECTNDAQRELLAGEMERYRQNFLEHQRTILRAMARTASSFITGPANFPTERNRKRMETEIRRGDEFLEWHHKAVAAIRRKLTDARTPEEKDGAAWAQLCGDITRSLAIIEGIDAGRERGMNRTAFVNSIAGRIERLAANGETSLVQRALTLVREYNDTHSRPAITSRHKVWKALEQAQARQQAALAPAGETEAVATGDGWRIERHPDADRVRIFFDNKPDAETRDRLKGSGWRWSPSAGAWQRKLTEAAVSNARWMLGDINNKRPPSP